MNIHRTSKSGLFLMELILTILFFAITSAVCVNLFANAHLTSVAGKDLNKAVVEVQTAAEMVKHTKGDVERLTELLGAVRQDHGITVFYNQDWQPIAENEQPRYQLKIVSSPGTDGMLYTDVEMHKGETLLYRIQVGSYAG